MAPRCLVIGVGKMGVAHLHVLAELAPDALAGWAPSSRRRASVLASGAEFLEGPLNDALDRFRPTHVIVASPVETLGSTTLAVLAAGVRDVLVEKPAALCLAEGERLAAAAAACGARVFVGYNRRFYGSVRSAFARMRSRGEQVQSVFFEFNDPITDPAGPPGHAPDVRSRWVLANSLHVIDMGLLPIGWPDFDKSCFLTTGSTSWHPSASIFTGAGKTEQGMPFGYHANWQGPGRWGVEWVTQSERYVFRPLEQLSVLRRGLAECERVDPADDLDQRFKPGVYLQDKAFLDGNTDCGIATLADALRLLNLGEAIGGYRAAQRA